jgi:hypothetical protein
MAPTPAAAPPPAGEVRQARRVRSGQDARAEAEGGDCGRPERRPGHGQRHRRLRQREQDGQHAVTGDPGEPTAPGGARRPTRGGVAGEEGECGQTEGRDGDGCGVGDQGYAVSEQPEADPDADGAPPADLGEGRISRRGHIRRERREDDDQERENGSLQTGKHAGHPDRGTVERAAPPAGQSIVGDHPAAQRGEPLSGRGRRRGRWLGRSGPDRQLGATHVSIVPIPASSGAI